MISVMCCGCLRLLAKNGSLIGEASVGGLFDAKALLARLAAMKAEGLADFDDKGAADAAAIRAGWSTTDDEGRSDHRCPECQRREKSGKSERQGAFIDWEELLLAGRDTPHEAATPTEAKS